MERVSRDLVRHRADDDYTPLLMIAELRPYPSWAYLSVELRNHQRGLSSRGLSSYRNLATWFATARMDIR